MEIIIILLLCALLAGVVYAVSVFQNMQGALTDTKVLQQQCDTLELSLQNEKQKLMELTQSLQQMREEKQNVQGVLDSKREELMSAQARIDSAHKLYEQQQNKIHELEMQITVEKKENDRRLRVFEEARVSFEQERQRILEKEQKKIAEYNEERHRIWNDHEQYTLSLLKDICVRPHTQFTYHDNTTLPSDFDGSFKPDFMIAFQSRYVIFDAKMSNPDTSVTLQTYIKNQAKSTAKKIHDSGLVDVIYRTVFFVIPSGETIKESVIHHDGIDFVVVDTVSVEGVLLLLKKMQGYEVITAFDPEEREDIARVLAQYDTFLSFENSVRVLLTQKGLRLQEGLLDLPEDFQKALDTKRPKKALNFTAQELKKSGKKESQVQFLDHMTEEQAPKIVPAAEDSLRLL